MLGTLTRFELKKLLSGKFFLIALCLLLFANVLLNCGIENYLLVKKAEENGTLIGGSSGSFWEQKAGVRRITAVLGEDYARLASLSPKETAEFTAAMEKKYGADVWEFPIPTEEMLSVPGYLGTDRSDFDFICLYQTLLSGDSGIREARELVVRRARSFGEEAEEMGDRYGIRRNRAIVHLYSLPCPPVTATIMGWDLFLFEKNSLLLSFLLIFLLCAGSVSGEGDWKTWLLLHTAKYGKGQTLAAKYLAGGLTAAGITLLFRLVSLGAVWFQSGLLGATQPAALLEPLQLCPWPMTVGQYALISLACQVFTSVVLSGLLTTVSALWKASLPAYVAGAALLGLFLVPMYLPPKAEWLSGPLALATPLKYFASCYTANLFTLPIPWAAVQAALWSALSLGLALLAHRATHRKRGAV